MVLSTVYGCLFYFPSGKIVISLTAWHSVLGSLLSLKPEISFICGSLGGTKTTDPTFHHWKCPRCSSQHKRESKAVGKTDHKRNQEILRLENAWLKAIWKQNTKQAHSVRPVMKKSYFTIELFFLKSQRKMQVNGASSRTSSLTKAVLHGDEFTFCTFKISFSSYTQTTAPCTSLPLRLCPFTLQDLWGRAGCTNHIACVLPAGSKEICAPTLIGTEDSNCLWLLPHY